MTWPAQVAVSCRPGRVQSGHGIRDVQELRHLAREAVQQGAEHGPLPDLRQHARVSFQRMTDEVVEPSVARVSLPATGQHVASSGEHGSVFVMSEGGYLINSKPSL